MNHISTKLPRCQKPKMIVVDNTDKKGILSDPIVMRLLEDSEFRTIMVRNGSQIFLKIHSNSLLALLFDGWSASAKEIAFLKNIRSALSELPIMVVSYSKSVDARIAAYEAGADDVLAAPCTNREFSARLHQLISRLIQQDEAILIGDMKLWLDSRIVMRNGRLIKLSQKEMNILLHLINRSPNPVSRTEILEHVFGLNFDPGTNAVEVHMHRLREKIDGNGNNHLLNTIRGIGYTFGVPESNVLEYSGAI